MTSRSSFAPVALAATALALGACGTAGLVPDIDVERDRDFQGRVYAGAGALVSQLEPDTDRVPDLELDDDVSAGGTVALGYDLSNRFAVEGSYATLGEATLSPAGEIEYRTYGLSALVYGLNDREARARREGVSAFGRLGVGGLQNDADVPYERVNDVHLLAGAGLEYGFANGIGVRGEIVAHETDARYAQLGLVYRFGDTEPRRGRRPERDAPTPGPTDAADEAADGAAAREGSTRESDRGASRESARAQREPVDRDRDGVADAVDDCPDTLFGRPVDGDGCALLDGAVEGVAFSGFAQGNALGTAYGRADAFVLPSRKDTWGLVVNEAMAAGLPVVVSTGAGCAVDLVDEGQNGITVPPGDATALANALSRIAALPDAEREAWGKRSRGIIAAFGLDDFCAGLWEAARAGSHRADRGLSPVAALTLGALRLAARRPRAFQAIPD